MQLQNIPEVKLGVIAVSRSCFPAALSERRRVALKAAYGEGLYECPVTVENEVQAKEAVRDVKANGVNALVVFLGNFGPETPETLIAQWFHGPIMYVAAAEGDGDLHDGRGDAYCGMLNCSYNLGLRGKTAYIPEYPVGTAAELAEKMKEFVPIARAILGLKGLKLITFGPRPDDFLACNGPIQALYDLGVAVEENSELDLLVAYNKHADDPRIPDKMKEMEAELGGNNPYGGILPRLAQYELTLLDWAEQHKGARQYVAFANKCWPAFQTEFKFVPCYVNSRLAAMGIPVSCEVDIYGALSEYIGTCVSGAVCTLLDINNTVPASIYEKGIKGKYDCRLTETFMGFHCGNTSCSLLKNPHMGYQLIMKRDLEPDLPEPDITRGTMEGNIKAGDITFFRLQSTADTQLKAYVAQGAVLDVDCESFGSIGAFAIPEMDRFYRHVLIAKRYPHHGAVAFGHWGKALFEVFKYLGIQDIAYNQPKSLPYPGENPLGMIRRSYMTPEEKRALQLTAVGVREGILTSTHGAKAGHPGGSLSAADMFTYLYFKEMHIDPKAPRKDDRDRFVLSKGHTAPGLYSALANRGFFPVEDLPTLRHTDSYLQGHPNMNTVPGVDMSTGSLGQGISAAAGMAKGAKFLNKDVNVYTLLGDGELAEGQVWEAAMFAAHYKLDNLCIIIDVNGLQIDGRTCDVMNTEPLDDKFTAFGCDVVKIDGHDFEQIETAFAKFHANHGAGKPICILMKTTKGKGVSYMEDNAGWHGKAPNDEEYAKGMAELAEARRALEV